MKIIKRSPDRTNGREVSSAFTEIMNRFFADDIFSTGLEKTGWNPRVDVYEKDNHFIVKADIPGMNEKDLNVEIDNQIMTISGTKEEEHETKEKNYHQIERNYGSFCRTVSLPENIETERINAEYKQGVLTVTLPKNKETISKKIQVKVS